MPTQAVTVDRAVEILKTAIRAEAREEIMGALATDHNRPAGPQARRPGRPPGPARRKGPIQLCPVPGCKGRAAPVFHMVCGSHKGLPKKVIAKYRAARREAKKS